MIAADLPSRPLLESYPFPSRYYYRPDGQALHYVDEGTGSPVIMVHGNPTWSFFYRRLIAGLYPKHRCLAPDHLGMGLSGRPSGPGYRLADRAADLTALVKHWQLEQPAHLIVHDWGGPIGLAWAVENPDQVASVTVLNSGTRVPPGYRLPLKLALFKYFTPLGAFLAQHRNLFVKGTATFGVTRRLSPEARLGFTAPYKQREHRQAIARFVEDIPLRPDHPSHDYLALVDRKLDAFLAEKPLTLVWGLRDFVFNRQVFLDWRQRFPRASSLVLPEAGHYLLEDEPERVLDWVSDFIEGVDSHRA